MDSAEPFISFDCYVIAMHHFTLKSTSRNAKIFWTHEKLFQGNFAWDGTICSEYSFDMVFIYDAIKNDFPSIKFTDINGVGIRSIKSGNASNKHSFIFIPK